MRKLNLAPYYLPNAETGEPDEYDVRNTLGEVLLAADQNVNGRELLANHDLFRKLRDHPEPIILLEEPDWIRLSVAFETVTGFSKNDVQIVERVLNAEEVEVQEKVKAPADNGAATPEAVPAVQ